MRNHPPLSHRTPLARGLVCRMMAGSLMLCPVVSSAAQEAEAKSAVPEQQAHAQEKKGDFEFECAHREKAIRVFGYRPSTYKDGPLLVLFHGASRNAEGYRNGARKLAEQLGMLLVVPEFDRARFDVEAYQEGGVMKEGEVLPEEQWTFNYLRPLLGDVFEREGHKLPYYLVGHSAGAQFLGRMAALYPNEAQRMILVNPGSLIFPGRDQDYPYGFGGLPEEVASDEGIKHYLSAPVTLYLGTGDVSRKALATTEQAMKQGPTRITRGRNCYKAGQQLAGSRDWAFSWTRVEAEGLDHGSGPMWEYAHCRLAITGVKAVAAGDE